MAYKDSDGGILLQPTRDAKGDAQGRVSAALGVLDDESMAGLDQLYLAAQFG